VRIYGKIDKKYDTLIIEIHCISELRDTHTHTGKVGEKWRDNCPTFT